MCTDGKTIEESPLYNPAQPYENRDPRLLKSIVCIGYPYLGMTITKENVATTGFGCRRNTEPCETGGEPFASRSDSERYFCGKAGSQPIDDYLSDFQ